MIGKQVVESRVIITGVYNKAFFGSNKKVDVAGNIKTFPKKKIFEEGMIVR
jgi:hypothetical protein